MIPLHKPPLGAEELASVSAALAGGVLDGDGPYGRLCSHELERITGAKAVLLTPSATAALELIALLLDIKPGDEIIMPSFTFPSAANAFALRGRGVGVLSENELLTQ